MYSLLNPLPSCARCLYCSYVYTSAWQNECFCSEINYFWNQMCCHGLIFKKSMVLSSKHFVILQTWVWFRWFETQTLSANRRMECALRDRSGIEKGKSLGCHVVLTWSSFKVNSGQSSSSATVGIVTTDIIKLAHCLPLCTVYTACRDVAIWKSQENPCLSEQETGVHEALHGRGLNWFQLANYLFHLGFCFEALIFSPYLFKE